MPRYEQEDLPPYVGLTGPAGCGKDTAAQGLCARFGYERFAFADPMKEALCEMTGLDMDYFTDRELKEQPIAELGGVSPRRMAQTLGTEWGRAMDPDWWVRITAYRARHSPLVVIPDVRFDNEATWIREHGGIVIKLHRDEVKPVEEHASEAGIDATLIDWHVVNDGDIQELHNRVIEAVERDSRSEGAWKRQRGIPGGETASRTSRREPA